MVKFAEVLESQAVPVWTSHYMSYNRLKRCLEKCVFLRTNLLKIQSINHKTPHVPDGDSDDETITSTITSNTQSTFDKIKKSHRIGRLSSVESKERLAVFRSQAFDIILPQSQQTKTKKEQNEQRDIAQRTKRNSFSPNS